MTTDLHRPELPLVIVVDVEPDHPWPSPGSNEPWRGFEAWLDYVPRLRERLARATGLPARFTWVLRMDDQVAGVHGSPDWVAEAYGVRLAELRAEGDELGLHPHAWRWQDPPGRWLQEHADPAWPEHVIATSFDSYRRAFGEPCRVHRFGSRFISPAIVRQVEMLGARVDLTVEPGSRRTVALEPTVPATGELPDQQRAPRVPYRPLAADPLRAANDAGRPASEGLWMLPLSAFDPGPLLPAWRRAARAVRFAGRPLHRPAELWAPVDAEQWWRLAVAAAESSGRPYLCLALRSDTLIRPALAPYVTAKLEALCTGDLAARVGVMTATAALDRLVDDR
jgi:hypothetical protein